MQTSSALRRNQSIVAPDGMMERDEVHEWRNAAGVLSRRNPDTAAVGSSGHEMSTAEKIRKLLHLSNTEIARRLDCSPAYVRTVRQRTSSNGSPILRASDRRWNTEVTRARAQMRAAKRAVT